MNAVVTGRCATVEQIGGALRAGTNCGSCRPEIRKIIEVHGKEKVRR
jgi:assimilatory nitrate reductase catalytic subunit